MMATYQCYACDGFEARFYDCGERINAFALCNKCTVRFNQFFNPHDRRKKVESLGDAIKVVFDAIRSPGANEAIVERCQKDLDELLPMLRKEQRKLFGLVWTWIEERRKENKCS